MGLFSAFAKKDTVQQPLKAGTSAPAFLLTDHKQNKVALSHFKNNNHVLLLFVKGVWCPTCAMMLRSFLKESEKLKQKNVVILSIGPDSFDAYIDYVKKLEVEFHMLADEMQITAMQYGVHVKEDKSKYEQGMPVPSSFLIDKNGIIRHAATINSSTALSPESVFPVLDSLD